MRTSNERFLDALGDDAELELARHMSQRRAWSFHDIIGREELASLAADSVLSLSEPGQLAFLGNLVVEKGHAEYDRAVSAVLDSHPTFRRWKNQWVAEEEPHGVALLEWGKARGLIDGSAAQQAVYKYLQHGFSGGWRNAASMMAYGALQEAATRLTHKNVKDYLPNGETHGKRILSNIIADEERHERFYANMVRHALHCGDREIASLQMLAVSEAVMAFEMPGMERDIEAGRQMSRGYRASGVFTFERLTKEVLLRAVDGIGSYSWRLEEVAPLTAEAERARDRLMEFVDMAREVRGGERSFLVLIARARRWAAEAVPA